MSKKRRRLENTLLEGNLNMNPLGKEGEQEVTLPCSFQCTYLLCSLVRMYYGLFLSSNNRYNIKSIAPHINYRVFIKKRFFQKFTQYLMNTLYVTMRSRVHQGFIRAEFLV